MTVDEIKDEVLRLVGPEGLVVLALRKRGYFVTGVWENENGDCNIEFQVSRHFSPKEVELDLRLLGDNAGLELIGWHALAQPKGDAWRPPLAYHEHCENREVKECHATYRQTTR